jgi:N-methylhydantoinase B
MDQVTVGLIRSSLFYSSEEMGLALRNASYSPNIKERMDHSAAIFDHDGRLLAQAEHIPVHLGSLPWGLKNILDYCKKERVSLDEGSMVVANNPYIAGTHLNDVTVIRPIYYSGKPVAYAANKAHHSDVGGKVPGSISTDALSLHEEGVIIDPRHLMKQNSFVNNTVDLLATSSRTPSERRGDLKAQAAANITGERRVREIISKYGYETFRESCQESINYAETLVKRRLSQLNKGTYQAEDYLESADGHDIRLRITIIVAESSVKVDYEGTARQVKSPLNAVFGVTLSGVYYVIRTITGDDVPANHGAFSPITVHAPEGTVLNPIFPYPVAGGNVETSQRNADLVYKALDGAAPKRVPAASGGSMNNVMMGGTHNGGSWAFYETIGVGLGGRNGQDGVDGIQANMTNTMNTPIEDIERTLPLQVMRYELRPDSSGAGLYRGGCGIVRAYKVLDTTIFTVLSERGRHSPWGLYGGRNGERTRITLRKASNRRSNLSQGKTVDLPVKTTLTLTERDIVEIQTAGGGGYGEPRRRNPSLVAEDIENGLISRRHMRASGYRMEKRRAGNFRKPKRTHLKSKL